MNANAVSDCHGANIDLRHGEVHCCQCEELCDAVTPEEYRELKADCQIEIKHEPACHGE